MSDHDEELGRRVDRYGHEVAPRGGGAPGRTTVTSRMPASARAIARAVMAEMNGVEPGADVKVTRAASGTGNALPDGLRGRFERSLATDLSGVRVHTDESAAQASAALGARAYATGQDVYMGAGQYAPETSAGAFLLAHEVAHTVQQRGDGAPACKLEVSTPGDAGEVEADQAAAAMIAGQPFQVSSGRGVARSIQRTRGRPVPGNSNIQLMPGCRPDGLIRRINQVAENLKNHRSENGAEVPLVRSATIDFDRHPVGEAIRAMFEARHFHEIPIAHSFEGELDGYIGSTFRLAGRVLFTVGEGAAARSGRGSATGGTTGRNQQGSSHGTEDELELSGETHGVTGGYRHQASAERSQEQEISNSGGITFDAVMNEQVVPLIAEFDIELLSDANVVQRVLHLDPSTTFPRRQQGVEVHCGTVSIVERGQLAPAAGGTTS